jgi:hypothetical protein
MRARNKIPFDFDSWQLSARRREEKDKRVIEKIVVPVVRAGKVEIKPNSLSAGDLAIELVF